MSTLRIASIFVLLASTTAACAGKTFSMDGADSGPGVDAGPLDASTVDGSTNDGGACLPTLLVCPSTSCGTPAPVCGSDLQWHCPAPPSCQDGSVRDSGPIVVVPVNHRADDSACLTTPPAGACNFQNTSTPACTSDDQCTAGLNGRCGYAFGGVPQCACSYDDCKDDSACSPGHACSCHGSPYNAGGNSCARGNCATDSDCHGNYCSPAVDPNSCGSLLGYYCHTSADECIDDKDCQGLGAFSSCTYEPAASRWQCKQVGACAAAPSQP